MAELVDLFPTLTELSGIPSLPPCPSKMDTSTSDACTEGKSLAAIVRGKQTADLKTEVALMQVTRMVEYKFYSGYSLVTQRYRQGKYLKILED